MIAAGCFIVRTRVEIVRERHLPETIREEQLAAPAEMVRELLKSGADVNATRDDGRTALMNAALMSWSEVVEMLLRTGANVNAIDSEGHPAIDFVDRRAHAEIAEMLMTAGSRPPTGRSPRNVCDDQRQLAGLGYDVGPIDCIAGKGFTKILADFQKKNSLPQSGTLDAATLRALRVE